MKTSEKTARQLRTFRIFKSLPKWDLHFISSELGLDLNHYDTHAKRAAGMTVYFYNSEGLTQMTSKIFNKVFGV